MTQTIWPEDVTFINSAEGVHLALSAPRAVVFLSVDWSGPERQARSCYRELVQAWGKGKLPHVEFFVVNEVDEALRRHFPTTIQCACTPLGGGTMFWLESGQVVAGEASPPAVGASRLMQRTLALWDDAIPKTTRD